jgi:ABC-type phosphate/phosphonate transport system substrate-binding protein
MRQNTMIPHVTVLRIIIFTILVLTLCQPDRGYTSYFLFYDPEWSFSSSTEAVQSLLPFCDFLSTLMNKDIRPLFLKKGDSLNEYLENPEVIAALINIHIVLEHHQLYSLIPLVMPVKHGMTTYQKALVVKKNSQINNFSDLKGKSLALVSTDEDNLEKQLSFIVKQDISDSFKFPGPIIKTVNSRSALSALVFGVSDSALTTLESFDELDAPVKEHLKILYLSPPIMNSPLVTIRGRISDEEKQRLRTALLLLHEYDRGKDILYSSDIESFKSIDMETVTAFFTLRTPKKEITSQSQPVEEMSQEVQTEQEIVYEVQKGDSLWKIAERFLGSGEKYSLILKYNKIDNPDHIFYGTKIIIPPRNGCENINGEQCHEKRNKKSHPLNSSPADN